jgi:APA family basic amino acid/polyamine antiporter
MEDQEATPHFKRSLSLFDATMIVAGSMIGSGIFIVSADMSRQLGASGYLLLAWVASAIITMIAALSYGELAGMMPKAGGQYVYIKEAWGSFVAFLYGWTCFTVIQTGFIAAVGVAFAKYTAIFIPALSTSNILLDLGFMKISAGQVFAIFIIIVLTAINTRGVKTGKVVQGIFTSTKLIALAMLIIVGLIIAAKGHFIKENFVDMWYGYSTVLNKKGEIIQAPLYGMAFMAVFGVAMVGSLFSSDAWNNVTFISAEIKNPERNIPRSLFLGTLIVGILYILANFTYLAILPMNGFPNGVGVMEQGIAFAKDDRVATAVISVILGSGATFIMAALIMISAFGCNNGIILSGARLYYAMAEDGLFFKQAMQLNKRSVPAKSLIFQCIWASVLCLSGKYGDLLDYITIASLIFYSLTIAGVIILRKKQPDTPRPYRVIGYPYLPILYIVIAMAIAIDLLIMIPKTTWPGIIIVLVGIPFYFILKKSQSAKT